MAVDRESVDCRVPWMFYNKNNKIKNERGGRVGGKRRRVTRLALVRIDPD